MPLAPQISQDLDGQLPWLPVLVEAAPEPVDAVEATVAPLPAAVSWLAVLADLAPHPASSVDTAVEPVPVALPWLAAFDTLVPLGEIDVIDAVVRPIPHAGGHTQGVRTHQPKGPLLSIWQSFVATETLGCADPETAEPVECAPEVTAAEVAAVEDELLDDELDEATRGEDDV